MIIQEIDQTLSFSGGASSVTRELILPSGISFAGLMVRFEGYGAGSTGALANGVNSMKIQINGQSPVQEAVNIDLKDYPTYLGMLLDDTQKQNIAAYADIAAVDTTNGNWFMLPWSHSNKTQIRVTMDLDMSVATGVFGNDASTNAVTVRFAYLQPGSSVANCFVLSKENFTGSTSIESVALPAWGTDETVVTSDTANAVTQIQNTALGLQIDAPQMLGPAWDFVTQQGADTDGFTNYYIRRMITPRAGAENLNISKSDASVTGTVYYMKAAKCAGYSSKPSKRGRR